MLYEIIILCFDRDHAGFARIPVVIYEDNPHDENSVVNLLRTRSERIYILSFQQTTLRVRFLASYSLSPYKY